MVMGQRKCPAEETTMTSMHRVHPAVSFASLYFGHASVHPLQPQRAIAMASCSSPAEALLGT